MKIFPQLHETKQNITKKKANFTLTLRFSVVIRVLRLEENGILGGTPDLFGIFKTISSVLFSLKFDLRTSRFTHNTCFIMIVIFF